MKLLPSFKRKAQDVTINFSSNYSRTENFQFVQASAASRRNFAGAGMGRLQADWSAKTTTRNDKIRQSLRTMRVRAREMVEDDEHALRYIALCQNNIIGASGLLFKNLAQDPNGKLDQLANKLIEAGWNEWGKPENCTVTRGLSWWELQNMLVADEPQSGEIFLRKVRGFKNKFGFALQMIEADCVDEQLNKLLPNGNRIRMGIEENAWGEVVAYWILTENPYDSYSVGMFKHERVPAADMIHKFIPIGLKQRRGIPWLHASMDSMHMLDKYDQAAMTAARMGAANGGFFEELPDAQGNYQGEGEDESGNTVMEISPGQFVQLPRGIKFSQYDSPYPHQQYGDFVQVRLRTIAAGLRAANYNQLTGDYERVTYTSLRAAFLESQDAWSVLQRHFRDVIAEEVFKDWLMEALLRGAIKLPADKFEKFNRPKFIGRGWAWVDPQKEIAAAKDAVANGFASRTHTISEQGGDIDVVDAEQEMEKQKARDRGLSFDGDKDFQRASTIGILARAGVITPSRDDEADVRDKNMLPPPSPEVEAAWDKSEGVRLPITLQTPDNFEIGNNGANAAVKPAAGGAAD